VVAACALALKSGASRRDAVWPSKALIKLALESGELVLVQRLPALVVVQAAQVNGSDPEYRSEGAARQDLLLLLPQPMIATRSTELDQRAGTDG
jgi:hypothetical protein